MKENDIKQLYLIVPVGERGRERGGGERAGKKEPICILQSIET